MKKLIFVFFLICFTSCVTRRDEGNDISNLNSFNQGYNNSVITDYPNENWFFNYMREQYINVVDGDESVLSDEKITHNETHETSEYNEKHENYTEGFNDAHVGIFVQNDILPFLYTFPTVPRMNVIESGPPPLFHEFHKKNSKISFATGFRSYLPVEVRKQRFKGLMSAAGFVRVLGMNASLVPYKEMTMECIVFQKDNVLVSVTSDIPHGTSICRDTDTWLPAQTVRMGLFDNWVNNGVLHDSIYFDENMWDFLRYEAAHPVWKYDIEWIFEVYSLKQQSIEFSIQSFLNAHPKKIAFVPSHDVVTFKFTLEKYVFNEFLLDFEIFMMYNRFNVVYVDDYFHRKNKLFANANIGVRGFFEADVRFIYCPWAVFIKKESGCIEIINFTFGVLRSSVLR